MPDLSYKLHAKPHPARRILALVSTPCVASLACTPCPERSTWSVPLETRKPQRTFASKDPLHFDCGFSGDCRSNLHELDFCWHRKRAFNCTHYRADSLQPCSQSIQAFWKASYYATSTLSDVPLLSAPDWTSTLEVVSAETWPQPCVPVMSGT